MSAQSTHLLLPNQVAQQLQVPTRRVLELRRRGEITGVNVGTDRAPLWRFQPADVQRFITARTVRGS